MDTGTDTDTDTENNFDEQHYSSYLRCYRKVKRNCEQLSVALDTRQDRIIRSALLQNIERYQPLHRINNIYEEMYSMLKKLLRLHNNQDIYGDDVIDYMIKEVKDMKRSVSMTINDMTAIIQEHVDMFALKDMTRPITNTYNIDYDDTSTATPLRRL